MTDVKPHPYIVNDLHRMHRFYRLLTAVEVWNDDRSDSTSLVDDTALQVTHRLEQVVLNCVQHFELEGRSEDVTECVEAVGNGSFGVEELRYSG